jgi:predicted MPP superfamily phosphohydrolase
VNRKNFLTAASGGLLSLAGPRILTAQPDSSTFRVGVIADTHIIDAFYRGPEGNPEDTANIFKTTESLSRTREFLNALRPKLDMVFIAGDFFHNYPSPDLDFYFQNKTRIDNAKALIDGFQMPVHVGFGNHDYGMPKVSREMSHELFRRKLGVKPYYAVDHKGFKFIHLNNFLGETYSPNLTGRRKEEGSFGEEQLNWLENELRQHRPTFLFLHFPLLMVVPTEVADYGLLPLLRKYKSTLQLVVAGHWHKWVEFGRTFGPPHQVVSSTRYDSNAYLILELDSRQGSHRMLNIEQVEWNTHFSRPWRGV